jgi:hypothetical protein
MGGAPCFKWHIRRDKCRGAEQAQTLGTTDEMQPGESILGANTGVVDDSLCVTKQISQTNETNL